MLTTEFNSFNKYFSYDSLTGCLRYRNANKIAAADNGRGYIVVCYKNKLYLAHRVCWLLHYGQWPKSLIDHKDEDKKNNKIINLRLTDQSGNLHNKQAINKNNLTSTFRGVSYDKETRDSKKWRARIMINRKTTNLGRFAEQEQAALAYLKAKAMLKYMEN